MLGMGGLGIPVSGHSNNPRRRRRRVDDLSPTQISETNTIRRAAAREHLGPTSAALQLRSRRVRSPAVRGAILNEAPGTTLEQMEHSDFVVTLVSYTRLEIGRRTRSDKPVMRNQLAEGRPLAKEADASSDEEGLSAGNGTQTVLHELCNLCDRQTRGIAFDNWCMQEIWHRDLEGNTNRTLSSRSRAAHLSAGGCRGMQIFMPVQEHRPQDPVGAVRGGG
ncbi:hypothetical protein B0H14DRAFT_2652736 [Mycena olivaceomarginata]|nr:hypothetical protein B0H14DRAFT_2652736 [Mycena olivaceomarginata]